MYSALELGGEGLRWAIGFYARHWPLVLGLSMMPAVQRFLVIRYGDQLPGGAALASEVIVMGVRVLLAWLVLRLMLAESGLGDVGWRERWQRFTAGIDSRPVAFWLQFVLLAVAFVLLDVLPELAVAKLVPASAQNLVSALLVSIKNPTVIALTMLWMVGVGRALMLVPAAIRGQ
jgi:hypothetical protein